MWSRQAWIFRDAALPIALGIAMIVFRRSWARSACKSQEFWFDRTLDEDAVVELAVLAGVVMLLFGLVLAGIRLTV